MLTKSYELVDHTADWALRVNGRNLAELFSHAALGMAGLMVADLETIALTESRQLVLEAYDTESLLVDWLTEFAFWAESEQLIFSRFEITAVTPTYLAASVYGGVAVELQKHIKAVTYHNLEIIKTDEGLEVTIVFDV